MSYPWQRATSESLFDVVRKQPLNFDSWLLITFDDISQDSFQQPRTALWFSGAEEGALFLESKLVPLWVPAADAALQESLVEQIAKLRTMRKVKIKDLEAWTKEFNQRSGSKGQILWYGPFDDFQRGEGSSAEVAQDLEFWLAENEIELVEINPDEPRHQKMLASFFVQLGA
jgi:hypothetical protein